ncbi:MAG TPA: rhodanese-like domain-containing protein [Crenotrichaceae bacterium]|nr:rhodanese-like domain-containing protein [Crenotrichaceae bacterium]
MIILSSLTRYLSNGAITLFFLTLTTTLSGCTNTEVKSTISANELISQIHSGSAPIILDTRSNSEYENGHIQGALYFPFWKAFFADQKILDHCKTEPVIVYCQHGPRASFAGFALKRSGCIKVLELEGHMSHWTQQGFPVISVDTSENTAAPTSD